MKQKRYDSEEKIIREIEANKERAKGFLAMAELLEDRAKEMAMLNDYTVGPEITAMKKDALSKRIRVRNIIEKKIPKLSKALAEFRTEPFQFFGEDKSVVTK